MSTEAKIAAFRQTWDALRAEIGKVIVGNDNIVEGTLIAIFAGGHVLLEGVPGLGKTLLVRTLSEVLEQALVGPKKSGLISKLAALVPKMTPDKPGPAAVPH